MRRLFYAVSVVVFCCAGFAGATELARGLATAVEDLSKAYADAYPGLNARVGVAVLSIEDTAADAKRNRIGETVSVYITEALGRSIVLSPVDRGNLDVITKELKLALSGMVEEAGAVELGNLTGVKALIWGSVASVQDRFLVALNLTDAETGRILKTASFETPKKDLIDASLELQYSYVAKNGIGLSLDVFSPILRPALFNRSFPGMVDFNANYRAARWLMISAGLMALTLNTQEHYRFEGEMPYQSLQPGIPLEDRYSIWSSYPEGTQAIYGPGQATAQFNYMLAHLDVQFTLNIHPKFNVGFSAGPVFCVTHPTMSYRIGTVNSLFYRAQFAEQAPGGVVENAQYYVQPLVDNNPIMYIFEIPGGSSGIGGRAEIRPEFFITPRFAVHGKIGYLLMPRLYVREVKAAYASWSYYQDKSHTTWTADPGFDFSAEKDNNWYNQKSSWIYYGWDPLKMPDGGRWALNLSCLYFQIGASFFF